MYRPCHAPVFSPSSGVDCALTRLRLTLVLVLLIILLAVTFGSAGILCMIRRAAYRMRYCREGNSDPEIDIGFTLDRWIRETPAIRSALIWRPDGETALAYPDWSREDKNELATLFATLEDSGTVDLPVEPPIVGFVFHNDPRWPEDHQPVHSESFELETARRTFFAHVAQSLRVEIRRLVSWTLHDFTPDELSWLFDSIHMYGWDSDQRLHVIWTAVGKATPGDPGRVYSWLQSHALIAGTERATILATLEWCRRLSHDTGGDAEAPDVYPGSLAGNEAHWQYEGFQPVERTLQGTVRLSFSTAEHWTHGCQGTTGLLRNVLRTVNIPVTRERGCEHAIPYFRREHVFLSHGDDPYSMEGWTPQIAMSELLIPDSRLSGFFDNCDHVGRGVTEAVTRLLPDQLIEMRCRDIESGASRSESEVLDALSPRMSLEELEGERLWERLDDEISRRGGCGGLI